MSNIHSIIPGPPPQYINPISQPPDQQPPLDPDNKMYGVAESGGLGDAAFAFSDQSIRMVFVRYEFKTCYIVTIHDPNIK